MEETLIIQIMMKMKIKMGGGWDIGYGIWKMEDGMRIDDLEKPDW